MLAGVAMVVVAMRRRRHAISGRRDDRRERHPDHLDRVDRREALKKAAIAAGVVAWTTPAVQVRRWYRPRPTVTGCNPIVTASLVETRR